MLKRVRWFARDEVDIRIGNGAKVAAWSIGVYPLMMPSGLMLELNNCYYVPALNKKIISSSCLEDDGYDFIIKNECCSIFMNDLYYGRCPVENGLYVLDLESAKINSINTKRIHLNNSNPTYLWYCHLGHIGKKNA